MDSELAGGQLKKAVVCDSDGCDLWEKCSKIKTQTLARKTSAAVAHRLVSSALAIARSPVDRF
jgi:hypothetical protein